MRIDQLEIRLQESTDETWERSRERWRHAEPNPGLTWARELTGDAFVTLLAEHDAFSPEAKILEIGPGYGRLLTACVARTVPFREYLGVDISATNVTHLQERFSDSRCRFLLADVEEMALEQKYDVLMSSLTFKHLYPSFERALRNCVAQLETDALVFFDVIEGNRRLFETDAVTYVRCYTRPEIQVILDRVGLEFVRFTDVIHDEDHRRLVTVAKKQR